MNQYLLFRSNGVIHGIKIKYVQGTGSDFEGEKVSASECFFGEKEVERHFIQIKDRVLSVSQVLDIVNILESYKVPSFFRSTPISEVAMIKNDIVVLLDVEKILDKCFKKGERYGQ